MVDDVDNVRFPLWFIDDVVQKILFDQADFATLCVLAGESEHLRQAIINQGRVSCHSCNWTFAEGTRFAVDFIPNFEGYPPELTYVTSDDLQIEDYEGNMVEFATAILKTFQIQKCDVEIPARTNVHLNFLFEAVKGHRNVQFDTVEIVAASNDAERWNYRDLALLLESLSCNTLITHDMRENIGYPGTVSINNVTINDRLWMNNVGLCNLDVKRIDINIPVENFEFTPVSVTEVIQAWHNGGLNRLEHFSCIFYHDPDRVNPCITLLNGIPAVTDDVPVYPDPPPATTHCIICRPVDQKCAYIGFKSALWDIQPVFWLLPWFPENRILPVENLNIAGGDPEDPPVPNLAAEEQVASNEDPVVPEQEDPGVCSDEEGLSPEQIKLVEEDSINVPICSNTDNEDPIEAKLDDKDCSVLNNAAEGSSNCNSNKRKRQSNVAEDPNESSTSSEEPMAANYSGGKRQNPDDDQNGPDYEPNSAKRRRV